MSEFYTFDLSGNVAGRYGTDGGAVLYAFDGFGYPLSSTNYGAGRRTRCAGSGGSGAGRRTRDGA